MAASGRGDAKKARHTWRRVYGEIKKLKWQSSTHNVPRDQLENTMAAGRFRTITEMPDQACKHDSLNCERNSSVWSDRGQPLLWGIPEIKWYRTSRLSAV